MPPMSGPVDVRDMIESDHPQICRVIGACFRYLAQRENWSPSQLETLMSDAQPEAVALQAANPSFRFLVGLTDSGVIGVVSWVRNEVGKLYVDPVLHRRGMGRLLFSAAEREIRKAGHTDLRLNSTASSVPFYTSMGMRVEQEKPWQTPSFHGGTLFSMVKSLQSET